MSVIHVNNNNSPHTLSDLGSAINSSNSNDQIKLDQNLKVGGGLNISHDLVIDGANHQIETSTGQVSLILTGVTLTLANLKIIVVDKSNFLKMVLETANHLIMNNVTIIHEPYTGSAGNVTGYNEHAASVYPSMLTHHDNQQLPIQSQAAEFHNCNIDYLTLDVNKLLVDQATILGDCLTGENYITTDKLFAENCQINNTHFTMSTPQDLSHTAVLNDVTTNGGITVKGNLNLNHFTALPINILRIKQFPLDSAGFSQYALTIENDNVDRMMKVNINDAHLSKQRLSKQSAIYNLAGWFNFNNAEVTINNSQFSATVSAYNEINGGSLQFNHTEDQSKWDRKNVQSPDQKSVEDQNKPQDQAKIVKLNPQKINSKSAKAPQNEALTSLDHLVGLKKVKQSLHDLFNIIINNRIRIQRGLKIIPISLNLVFAGRLGTGKKTVARDVSQSLAEMGILSNDKLEVVQGLDLIDEFVGATPDKTKQVVQKALDGVLFIDHADQLAADNNESENQFKTEALETLAEQMKINASRLVVILAGDPQLMNNFMKQVPKTLQKQFNDVITFPDYSVSELLEIIQSKLNEQGMHCEDDAKTALISHVKALAGQDKSNNNAIFSQTISEELLKQQATRIGQLNRDDLTNDDLTTITKVDVLTTFKNSHKLQLEPTNVNQSFQGTANAKAILKKALSEAKNSTLQTVYHDYQCLDDANASYEDKINAGQELLKLRQQYQKHSTDKIAQLILPFLSSDDDEKDYHDLVQQLDHLKS